MKDDDFYFVTVLIRRKDNPGIAKDCFIVATYTILTETDLCNKAPIIKSICDATNARAYIYPYKSCFDRCADIMLNNIATAFTAHNGFQSVRGMFESAAPDARVNKKYIVDMDGYSVADSFDIFDSFLHNSLFESSSIQFYTVPTPNGSHIVSDPFNVRAFEQFCLTQGIPTDITKTKQPTLLYCNLL